MKRLFKQFAEEQKSGCPAFLHPQLYETIIPDLLRFSNLLSFLRSFSFVLSRDLNIGSKLSTPPPILPMSSNSPLPPSLYLKWVRGGQGVGGNLILIPAQFCQLFPNPSTCEIIAGIQGKNSIVIIDSHTKTQKEADKIVERKKNHKPRIIHTLTLILEYNAANHSLHGMKAQLYRKGVHFTISCFLWFLHVE